MNEEGIKVSARPILVRTCFYFCCFVLSYVAVVVPDNFLSFIVTCLQLLSLLYYFFHVGHQFLLFSLFLFGPFAAEMKLDYYFFR